MQTRGKCNEKTILIEKGMTSIKRTLAVLPAKTLPWIEAPILTVSSELKTLLGSRPKMFLTVSGVQGIRVPTKMTLSIVFLDFLDHSRQDWLTRDRNLRAMSHHVLHELINLNMSLLEMRNWCVMRNKMYALTIPRNNDLNFSAAHGAFSFLPLKQPSSSNNGWRTGSEMRYALNLQRWLFRHRSTMKHDAVISVTERITRVKLGRWTINVLAAEQPSKTCGNYKWLQRYWLVAAHSRPWRISITELGLTASLWRPCASS
jgi:hypothetical protein